MIKARWKKGKQVIEGSYEYVWHKDAFIIRLNKKDKFSGRLKDVFEVTGDYPTFNGWVLEWSEMNNFAVISQEKNN